MGSYFLGCFQKNKIFKKGLGLGALDSYFLNCFKKKKNHQSKFSIPLKNSRFPNISKKKKNQKSKKKSSLKSSSGIESYDPLPYSPVMQHQINYPPLAFIEA